MPTGSNKSKQMTIVIAAKDATKAAWKSVEGSAQDAMKALKTSVKSVELAFLGLETAILGSGVFALKKMVTVAKDIGIASVASRSEMEQLSFEFENMMGSAEEGAKALLSLTAATDKLPFTTKAISETAKKLREIGMLGPNVGAGMKAVGDMAVDAGVGVQEMGDALSRIWLTGSIGSRGPSGFIRGMLKTKMGLDVAKLSTTELGEAITKLMMDPQYGVVGIGDKFNKTFEGIKIQIQKTWTTVKNAIADTGLFDEVKRIADTILKYISGPEFMGTMKRLGDVLTGVVRSFREKLEEMVKNGDVTRLLEQWVGIIRTIGNVVKNIISNIPQIAGVIFNIAESIALTIESIAKAIDGVMRKVGVITGKTLELELAAKNTHSAWKDSDTVLAQLRDRHKEINEALSVGRVTTGDVARAYDDVLNIVTKVGGGTDEYKTQLADINKYMAIYNDEHTTAQGHAAMLEAITESMNDILTSVEGKQSGISEQLGVQYNTVQDQLATYQDNYVANASIGGVIGENIKKLKEMKWIDEDTVDTVNAIGDGHKEVAKSIDGENKTAAQLALKMKDAINAIEPPKLKLSAEVWDDFMNDFVIKYKAKGADIVEIMKDTASAAQGAFSSLFFDVLTGQFKSFGDYLKAFWNSLAQEMANMMSKKLVNTLFDALASGASAASAGGGSNAQPTAATINTQASGSPGSGGFQHGGIVMGMPGVDRNPVRATKGEMILTQRQQANLFNIANSGGGSRGDSIVTNHITAMDSQDVFRALDKNKGGMWAAINKSKRSGFRGARG
jgi:hypothetical protein